MTENLAARGEGLAELVAEIKAIADAIVTTNAYRGRQLHRVGEKLLALEAAAPAGTAPPTSDYPGCTVNELALELKRAVMVLCETRGHTGARPCKFCTDMHLWRLYQSIAEPLRTCNCGSPAGPHCESVHVAALATPSPQAPPILLQDFNAKSGFGVFVVTGEHQRTAFFTRAAAEQYLAQQDPERFRIVMYPKPPAATQEQPAGSVNLQATKDETRGDVCEGNAPRLLAESPSTFGSPRKVGEDGAEQQAVNAILRGVPEISNDIKRSTLEFVIRAAFRGGVASVQLVARPSSVPVGEQKQEEGV